VCFGMGGGGGGGGLAAFRAVSVLQRDTHFANMSNFLKISLLSNYEGEDREI